jgi:hypothetical protein
VSRPPLVVVFVAVLLIALGELGGAVLSQLRPAVARWVAARVAANPAAHGLSGSAEYDDAVREQVVFTAEAGLSFFHTHAEGMGLVLFFAATLVASVVRGRAMRAVLHAMLTAGALFPLGYLLYATAAVGIGRDAGVTLAEAWVLTPLGTTFVLGLVGLVVALGRRPRPSPEA